MHCSPIMSSGCTAVAVPDGHALDAVFAWLDGESLLRAGAVCRRWRERAARDEAWRGRLVTEVGWARGMHPRDVLLMSLNCAAGWRRRRVTPTELARGDARWLCADGDWLAYREAEGRFLREPESGAFAWRRAVRIHDAGAEQTVATLPVDAEAAAASRAGGRCATLHWDAHRRRSVCDVWTASADDHDDSGGGGWRRASTLELPYAFYDVDKHWVAHSYDCGLRWQNETLLVYGRGTADQEARVCAEWLDAGTGALRSVARHSWRSVAFYGGARTGWIVGVGASSFVVTEDSMYVLDPRTDTDRRPPPSLLRLRQPSGGAVRRRIQRCDALDDGRHIALHWRTDEASSVELWDVRAARADAVLGVDPRWEQTLCTTARGTVLGWSSGPDADGYHRGALMEWDAARGTVDERLAVRFHPGQPRIGCVWADERRAVVRRGDAGLYVFDAAPGAPRSSRC